MQRKTINRMFPKMAMNVSTDEKSTEEPATEEIINNQMHFYAQLIFSIKKIRSHGLKRMVIGS